MTEIPSNACVESCIPLNIQEMLRKLHFTLGLHCAATYDHLQKRGSLVLKVQTYDAAVLFAKSQPGCLCTLFGASEISTGRHRKIDNGTIQPLDAKILIKVSSWLNGLIALTKHNMYEVARWRNGDGRHVPGGGAARPLGAP